MLTGVGCEGGGAALIHPLNLCMWLEVCRGLEVDVRRELLYTFSTFVCGLTDAQTKRPKRSLSLPLRVTNSLYRAAN